MTPLATRTAQIGAKIAHDWFAMPRARGGRYVPINEATLAALLTQAAAEGACVTLEHVISRAERVAS